MAIANDPVVAQGANTASRCAAAYLAAILDHGDEPFDRAWMQATAWTNGILQPPPQHVQRLLGAAAQYPEVANGFADPNDLIDWFMTPQAADRYLSQVAARATSSTPTANRSKPVLAAGGPS